ncbi:MAG TPA: alkaline phosphatase family protein [Thermoleophilaceae bacterium]
MGEFRDPEAAERLAFHAPDEYLRRREFLGRTAMLAGLAAGMGVLLDPETLVAEAAARQGKVPLPSPRNLPIDTFVVLMMENRSFDHYLGWLPSADGRQAGLSYTDTQGNTFQTHRLTPDFQGCAFLDPDHSWQGGRTQLDGGKMDGFLRAQSDVFSIGYYEEHDLPFIPSVARAFTTYDRFFCSLLGSTFPNREYMHAAQSYGMTDNSLPVSSGGFPDTTIFHALSQKGVSNRYFFTDLPVAALWGAPGLARSGHVQEYYERCAHGTLPHVSFVDPQFEDEDSGTSGDEHPHGDVRAGQAFMSDVVHAFMESPQWKRGALFIVYDEWGGFFDHVRPPRVPDIRSSQDLSQDFGQMGFRIPAVAVSPWVRRHHVDHTIYGFESILKMIEYRFGLAPLTVRDKYARNIARSFDFEGKPRLALPHLPDPAAVMSHACQAPVVGAPNPGVPLPGVPLGPGVPAAQLAKRRKPHDLAYLNSSGYLERLGFHYKPATADTTFRHPSQVKGR